MFYLQISTRYWEIHTACPVHCLLSTTINGILSAQPMGVRTICCGVLPALSMMRLKDGASVQC